MTEKGYNWKGVKMLRKKYIPKHCKFKNADGNYIPESKFPEEAAKYLSEIQWKTPGNNTQPSQSKLSEIGQAVKHTAWDLSELDTVLKNLKPNKTPGPDEISSEMVKWLDGGNRSRLLLHYNDILLHGKYYDSLNLANIASIFKKGDPAKLENYRPIALLQILYKILAALLKYRLVDGVDPWLLKTQFGFSQKEVHGASNLYSKKTYGLGRATGDKHIFDFTGLGKMLRQD